RSKPKRADRRDLKSDRKIDKSALRVRRHKLHSNVIAHIEAFLRAWFAGVHQHSFDGRVKDADKRAVLIHAGHYGWKNLANPRLQRNSRNALLHVTLYFARGILHQRA